MVIWLVGENTSMDDAPLIPFDIAPGRAKMSPACQASCAALVAAVPEPVKLIAYEHLTVVPRSRCLSRLGGRTTPVLAGLRRSRYGPKRTHICPFPMRPL